MANEPAQARFFDEKEVGFILKRATELQGVDKDEHTTGLTLAELSRIAEETGIDPQYVSAAITELDMHSVEDSPNLWGGPLSLTLDRVVQGQVNETTWEALLSEIRHTFRDVGQVTQRGTVWEWSRGQRTQGTQQACVTAMAEDNHTRLRIAWNEPITAVPSYVLAGTLGLILIPVIFDSLGMVSFTGGALYLTLIAMLYSLARWTVIRSARKKKGEIRQLMIRLEQVLGGHEQGPVREHTLEDLASTPLNEDRLRLDTADTGQELARSSRQPAPKAQRS